MFWMDLESQSPLLFLNGPTPATSIVYFRSFQTRFYNFLQQIYVKMSIHIGCRDSNPQSSERESPPITTRPRLLWPILQTLNNHRLKSSHVLRAANIVYNLIMKILQFNRSVYKMGHCIQLSYKLIIDTFFKMFEVCFLSFSFYPFYIFTVFENEILNRFLKFLN